MVCMAYFWNNVRQVGSVKHDSKLLLVLNATFNNVSVDRFLVEETGIPGENH